MMQQSLWKLPNPSSSVPKGLEQVDPQTLDPQTRPSEIQRSRNKWFWNVQSSHGQQ
jgi:hypothetical protein